MEEEYIEFYMRFNKAFHNGFQDKKSNSLFEKTQ